MEAARSVRQIHCVNPVAGCIEGNPGRLIIQRALSQEAARARGAADLGLRAFLLEVPNRVLEVGAHVVGQPKARRVGVHRCVAA